MSTFNGGKLIRRQVITILEQKELDVHIIIRDDGSNSNTKFIIEEIKKEFSGNIDVEYGTNIGWKKSFQHLLQSAPLSYDYYGFADQDDIWKPDKLVSCIQLMEKDINVGVKLAHCNALSADADLKLCNEQKKHIPCPPNYKAAIATECFQGCSMVWNHEAMKLLQSYEPKNVNLAHDYWVGLVCYLFGTIYFCEDAKFYHVRYGNNESNDGSIWKGRRTRIRQLWHSDNAYMNPSDDLLTGYGDRLDAERKEFIEMIASYKDRTANRYRLIIDRQFRRPSIWSTLLLKIALLLKKY